MTLVGFNFSYPFLPLFIRELGVIDRSELTLWPGVAIGGSGLVMALASPVWGLLADRFGRKAMLVRSVAAGAGVLAVQSLVGNVGKLLAVRLANGAFTGSQTAGAMLVAGIVPRVGVILYVDDAPRPKGAAPEGVRGNARDVFVPFAWPGLRRVLIIGIAMHALYSGSAGVMAVYIQDLSRPLWLTTEMAVGLAFALGAVAMAVAMPLLGGFADRRHPRRLLMASLALTAIAPVPQTIVPSAIVFLVCRVFVGIGLAGVSSSLSVLTRMAAPVGAEGRGFGALAAAQNLGWGIRPILGAAFAGIPALYVVSAALMVLMLAAVRATPSWFARRPVPRTQLMPVIGAEPAD